MFRNWVSQLFGFAMAMSVASNALCQNKTVYDYNQQYNQAKGSQQMSLNQMALRNAEALTYNSLQPTTPAPGAARVGLGLTQSMSGNKPFAGFSQGPTISPYMNLFRTDLSGNNGLNYSTLVAPELKQQQINQQQQRDNLQVARNLESIAAQSAFNPQGSKEELPTGHQTVFQYYDHYYTTPRPRQKKRAQQ